MLNKKYPQNYLLQKPYIGTLVFLGVCLGFVLLYKPLDLHQAGSLNFEFTMVIYLCAMSLPIFIFSKLVKSIRYFSNPNEWTFLKEIVAITIILLGMGISIYFMGFLMEVPGSRWNFATLFDSIKHTFLIGIIPFLFFTAFNYRHLFASESVINYTSGQTPVPSQEAEQLLSIVSRLKKEELSFYPSQFIYAESDGNYVVFYLKVDDQIRKKIIRNSINTIAEQLAQIPYFFRTHRGFIVNVRYITSKKGNTLGYRLKLEGIDDVIPVSRQNSREFDQVLKLNR